LNAEAWIEQGDRALEADDYGEAAAASARAIELEPENPKAWALKGVALAGSGKSDDALSALTRASELDPHNADVWWLKGELLTNAGSYQDALESLTTATTLDDTLADARVSLGIALVHLGRPLEALQAIDEAVLLDSGCAEGAEALWVKGVAMGQLGRLPEAAGAFQRWTELEPESPVAWWHLGSSRLQLGQHDEALRAFDTALRLDPGLSSNPSYWRQRAQALTELERYPEAVEASGKVVELAPEGPEIGAAYLFRGIALYSLGNCDDSLRTLKRAEERTANEQERGLVWLHEGIALNGLRKHDEALGVLNKAMRVIPEDSPLAHVRGSIWFQRGLALNGLGNARGALKALDHVLVPMPEQSPLRRLRGPAWFQKSLALDGLRRSPEALMAAKGAAAEEWRPSTASSPVWLWQGILLLKVSGDVEAALEAFRKATDLDPANADAWSRRGETLARLGRFEEALDALDEALARTGQGGGGQRATILVARAAALNGLQQPQPALEALSEAADLDSTLGGNLELVLLRATALARLGRPQALLDELAAARRLNPDLEVPTTPSVRLLQLLQGKALVSVGRIGEAMEVLGSAGVPPAESDESGTAWYFAGIARLELQRHEAADEALRRASQLDPAVEQLPDYWLSRSMALSGLSQQTEALEALTKAVTLSAELEKWGLVWLLRGTALRGLGQHEEALAACDRVTKLARRNPPPESDRLVAAALVQQGAARLSMNQADAALAAFTEAVERAERLPEGDPSQMVASLCQAQALRTMNRVHDALESFARATDLSAALPPGTPGRNLAWRNMGDLLTSLKRDEEALRAVTKAATLDPEDAGALIAAGDLLVRLQEYSQARRTLDAAAIRTHLGNGGQRADLYFVKGKALSGLRRYKQAATAYRAMIALEQYQAGAEYLTGEKQQVWEFLGEARSRLGRHEAAYRAYDRGWRCLEDKSDPRAVSLALGVSSQLIALEQYQPAADFLTGAKQEVGSDARVDHNLGVALYRLGKQDAALRALEAAAGAGFRPARDLINEVKRSMNPLGAWFDHWFGRRAGRGRKLVGGALFVLLTLAVLPVSVRPDLKAGPVPLAVVPLVVFAVLLVLPVLGDVLRNVPLKSLSASVGPVKLEAVTAPPPSALTPPPLRLEELLRPIPPTQRLTEVGGQAGKVHPRAEQVSEQVSEEEKQRLYRSASLPGQAKAGTLPAPTAGQLARDGFPPLVNLTGTSPRPHRLHPRSAPNKG
jgi:superkiller protein 3